MCVFSASQPMEVGDIFHRSLVVPGNGATKVALEHNHSKHGAYVVKLRFPKAR